MRMFTTVIYTDKLAEVRAFYQRYFSQFLTDERDPYTFTLHVFAEAQISWIDAAWAQQPVTAGASLRVSVPYTEIEHPVFVEKGAPCGELTIADWGATYRGKVQYFSIVDPSGTQISFYEDQIGEKRQIMITGDGKGTRALQNAPKAPQPPPLS